MLTYVIAMDMSHLVTDDFDMVFPIETDDHIHRKLSNCQKITVKLLNC